MVETFDMRDLQRQMSNIGISNSDQGVIEVFERENEGNPVTADIGHLRNVLKLDDISQSFR